MEKEKITLSLSIHTQTFSLLIVPQSLGRLAGQGDGDGRLFVLFLSAEQDNARKFTQFGA